MDGGLVFNATTSTASSSSSAKQEDAEWSRLSAASSAKMPTRYTRSALLALEGSAPQFSEASTKQRVQSAFPMNQTATHGTRFQEQQQLGVVSGHDGSKIESDCHSVASQPNFMVKATAKKRNGPDSCCSYCGQDESATMVKCMDCNKWFCNGTSETKTRNGTQKESHIIIHLRASKHHRSIAVYDTSDQLTAIRCTGPDCDETNCFDMGTVVDPDKSLLACCLCRPCAIQMKKFGSSDWLILVDCHNPALKCIREELVAVPGRCRRISAKDIADKERKWLLQANGIQVPGETFEPSQEVLETFNNTDDYIEHFHDLVSLERDLTEMETRTIPILENITITARDTDRTPKWFEFKTCSQTHKNVLTIGQRVLVRTKQNCHPDGQEATIKFNKELKRGAALIRVQIPSKTRRIDVDDSPLSVEVAFQDTVHYRQLTALERFDRISPLTQNVVLGLKPEEQENTKDDSDKKPLVNVPDRKLNPSQELAVRTALKNPFSLIQGPPGTGKTHTIVALIYNMLASDRDTRILCSAPSNDPTDHLAVQLARSGIFALRIHSSRIDVNLLSEELKGLSLTWKLEQLLGKDYENTTDRATIDRETKTILNKCQVVCITCNSAASRAMFGWPFNASSSAVIIDEATQATEADALIPITLLPQNGGKVVLIGDHKQLGVTSRFRELENTNLGSSLFERLIRLRNVPSVMLDTQFRMHGTICEPASRVIYEGMLKTGDGVSEERERPGDALQFIHLQPRFSPLVMIDIAAFHEMAVDGASSVNGREAMVVTLILMNLLHRGVKPTDIGVITFYNGQKAILGKTIDTHLCIPNSARKDLMIDSVDAFQGREKEFIILSCVRAGDSNNVSMGFLADKRRLNVALTRAKSGVIMVGDRTLLEKSVTWQEFLRPYLHVEEAVALGRLGVSDFDHPNCFYCDNPGKRFEICTAIDVNEIAELIRRMVNQVKFAKRGHEQETVARFGGAEVAYMEDCEKRRVIAALFDRYIEAGEWERIAIIILLVSLVKEGRLSVEILNASFAQQIKMRLLYPEFIVDLLGPLVAKRLFPVALLSSLFANGSDPPHYRDILRQWLLKKTESGLSHQTRQDLLDLDFVSSLDDLSSGEDTDGDTDNLGCVSGVRQYRVKTTVRGLLNKITPTNYEKLSNELLKKLTETPELLFGAVEAIFDQALDELNDPEIYAKLCRKLMDLETKPDGSGRVVKFRVVLLHRVQDYFEKSAKQSQLQKADEEFVKISAAEAQEKNVKAMRRYLGSIRFISELYRLKMLTDKIIKPDSAVAVQTLFDQLKKMIDGHVTSSRIRFLMQDTIDLRKNNYVARKTVAPAKVKPKTLQEIHEEKRLEELAIKNAVRDLPPAPRGQQQMQGGRSGGPVLQMQGGGMKKVSSQPGGMSSMQQQQQPGRGGTSNVSSGSVTKSSKFLGSLTAVSKPAEPIETTPSPIKMEKREPSVKRRQEPEQPKPAAKAAEVAAAAAERRPSVTVNGEVTDEMQALEVAAVDKPHLPGRLVFDRSKLLELERSFRDAKLSDDMKKKVDSVLRNNTGGRPADGQSGSRGFPPQHVQSPNFYSPPQGYAQLPDNQGGSAHAQLLHSGEGPPQPSGQAQLQQQHGSPPALSGPPQPAGQTRLSAPTENAAGAQQQPSPDVHQQQQEQQSPYIIMGGGPPRYRNLGLFAPTVRQLTPQAASTTSTLQKRDCGTPFQIGTANHHEAA
ncbi:ATP-dependent helicase NAM7 [Hypsibius exemplaris]|uniref:ATP-dependent helicase NAM7 n=1 Tax=Hypsibius exemplaris TaxID=2072580 RepID=A0A1W0WU63_HYPEX|nr:ATP-dependent helicase NAM7 [Hypsibius exemplaris]